jgi:hypothetical protein
MSSKDKISLPVDDSPSEQPLSTSVISRHEFFEMRVKELGLLDPDSDYSGDIGKQVLALSTTFNAYGHSEGSAHSTLGVFYQLFREYYGFVGIDHELELALEYLMDQRFNGVTRHMHFFYSDELNDMVRGGNPFAKTPNLVSDKCVEILVRVIDVSAVEGLTGDGDRGLS